MLAVIESQAYKEQTVPILIYDDSSIRSVIAYGSNMTEEAYTVADREQIIGIASALRKDILDDQNVNTSNEETADDAEKTCISVDFCYDIPEEKDASGKVIQTRTQYFNISITEDYKNTWEALDRYHLLPAQ